MKKLVAMILTAILLLSTAAFAENTQIKITCPNHRAELTCPSCGWKGGNTEKVACSDCYGTGRVTCKRCGGSGYETCSFCGGTGTIKTSKYTLTCTNCNGNKRFLCGKDKASLRGILYDGCYGSGKMECTTCYGSGKVTAKREKCPDCGKSVVCSICRNLEELSYFKSELEAFEYRKVMRSPQDKIGQYYIVEGSVLSIENIKDNAYSIKLYQKDNTTSYQYEMIYFAQEGSENVLKGDTIKAYCLFSSYDNNNIPTFITAEIELVE